MTIREIIKKLEDEKQNLVDENKKLKNKIECLEKDNKHIETELDSLKNLLDTEVVEQKKTNSKMKKERKLKQNNINKNE